MGPHGTSVCFRVLTTVDRSLTKLTHALTWCLTEFDLVFDRPQVMSDAERERQALLAHAAAQVRTISCVIFLTFAWLIEHPDVHEGDGCLVLLACW